MTALDNDSRWARRTLRFRLTAGVLLLLFLACAVVGGVTTLSLQHFLTTRLDEQLQSAGGRYSASLEHRFPKPGKPDGDGDNKVISQDVGTLGVRLVGGVVREAVVIARDGTSAPITFGPKDAATLVALPQPGGATTITLESIGDYRVQTVAGQDGDVQVTGLPMDPVSDVIKRLLAVEIAVFAGVLLVGAVVAAYSVRLTLRPLNRIADSALDVASRPLSTQDTLQPVHLPHAPPGTEIGQVTQAFEKMMSHVAAALAARSRTESQLRQFVADASHEIRTPLAVIRSHTELALSQGEQIPITVCHSLGRIAAHTVRISELVDDLLLLARLDSGVPGVRLPIDMSRMAVESVSDATIAGADHVWRLDLPPAAVEIVGDERQLQQVFNNLLSNARLHTPAGTLVTFRIRETAGYAVVTITDTGPGISSDLLPTVFDRFSQGSTARSTATGGTGLGLAIARALVEANEGDLSVDSVPGRTEFALRFPVASNAPVSPR
ncbi:sensor histidine kinase [Nakamurella antarctica]|uniref:histidine kinase n=1 Tax=Nakamurella antarctica TaxID=1902245 RepID=A0A3G8ZUQ6_9ACTN|nr:HAMP domain-containing sensor histidine kinase [Nakamurella antarctica]AZI58234.1 sensor histidine kinase [Nakamurella antarctica]